MGRLHLRPPPPPRLRRPTRATGPVRTETPSAPTNTPLYEGQTRGGHAILFINSQNTDYSTFTIVARELFLMMQATETTLSRVLPFAVFQHYLSEILNATIIKRSILQNVEGRFAFDVIHAEHYTFQNQNFINGIGVNLLQNADKVYVNLPNPRIPNHRLLTLTCIQAPLVP